MSTPSESLTQVHQSRFQTKSFPPPSLEKIIRALQKGGDDRVWRKSEVRSLVKSLDKEYDGRGPQDEAFRFLLNTQVLVNKEGETAYYFHAEQAEHVRACSVMRQQHKPLSQDVVTAFITKKALLQSPRALPEETEQEPDMPVSHPAPVIKFGEFSFLRSTPGEIADAYSAADVHAERQTLRALRESVHARLREFVAQLDAQLAALDEADRMLKERNERRRQEIQQRLAVIKEQEEEAKRRADAARREAEEAARRAADLENELSNI